MVLKYNVKLKNLAKFEKDANKALAYDANKMLNKAAIKITAKLRIMIKKAITESPEYQSCNGGSLQGELGLPSVSLLDNIINQWASNIYVKIKPTRVGGSGISGGFTISAIQADWGDVLKMPEASITSGGKTLPWLDWLLTYGNKVIVREYTVHVTTKNPKSRSGKAVMVKDARGRWRVPPNFSGTSKNNFVTRAIDGIWNDVKVMILKEILKAVK